MQINSFTATGRLGRDPETVFFESGSSSTKFSLAVDKNTSKKDDPPSWFECVAWNKTGEIVANYCKKGSLVGINGSIYLEKWDDKETGDTRSKVVLRVNQVTLLSSKSENSANTTSVNLNTYLEDF